MITRGFFGKAQRNARGVDGSAQLEAAGIKRQHGNLLMYPH